MRNHLIRTIDCKENCCSREIDRLGLDYSDDLDRPLVLDLPKSCGVGRAWLLFNGRAASSFEFQFYLVVTPSLALLGIAWALGMGLIGGLLPAVRAARVPVTVALRAT